MKEINQFFTKKETTRKVLQLFDKVYKNNISIECNPYNEMTLVFALPPQGKNVQNFQIRFLVRFLGNADTNGKMVIMYSYGLWGRDSKRLIRI